MRKMLQNDVERKRREDSMESNNQGIEWFFKSNHFPIFT